MKIYKKRLKNGFRILFIPIKVLSNFTALLLVGTGSRFEKEKVAGISHFLEHMFFKGTKKRPTTLLLSSELDQIGAEYNAFTSKEYTGYYIKSAPKHFELALDILSDMYFNSSFKEEEINRERGVIAEEINLFQDTPIRYVADLFEKTIFEGKPLGRLIIGAKKSLANISRRELISYFRSHYAPHNAVICLAGNIGVKQPDLLLKKYFEKKSLLEDIKKNKENYPQKKPRSFVHYKETDQTHFILGVKTFGTFDERRFALKILATILGGNMSSRFFIKIRERLGLAYYIKTESEHYLDSGHLSTQAGVSNDKIETVIKLIIKEYEDISKKGVGRAELKKAKEYLKGKIAVSLDETEEIAEWAALQEILRGDVLTPQQICGRIERVGQKDIKTLSKEIFKNNRLNLAVIGPFKDKNRFSRILTF